jgi:hypothetical protein
MGTLALLYSSLYSEETGTKKKKKGQRKGIGEGKRGSGREIN